VSGQAGTKKHTLQGRRDGERRPMGDRTGSFVGSVGEGIPATVRADWVEERHRHWLWRE
jgi:hypothetical protein